MPSICRRFMRPTGSCNDSSAMLPPRGWRPLRECSRPRNSSSYTPAGRCGVLPAALYESACMRTRFDLFVVSFLVLFLELAAIRWFPANVLFLTFFTNTVLLACFLGMSVGCLAADRPRNYLTGTPFLLALALGAAHLVEWARTNLGNVEIGSLRVAAARLLRRGVSGDGSVEVRRPDRDRRRRAVRADRPRDAWTRTGPRACPRARAEPARGLHHQHRRQPRRRPAVHCVLVLAGRAGLVVRRQPSASSSTS